MAMTPASGDLNSVATYYSNQIEKAFVEYNYFARLMGVNFDPEIPDLGFPMAGVYTPIVLYAELLERANRGKTITIPTYTNFTAAATSDNLSDTTKLEGNESTLSDSTVTITPLERGKGVVWANRTAKKISWDMLETARGAIQDWADTKFDLDVIAVAEANTTNIIRSGDAVSTAEIDSSDTLTVADIQKATTLLRNQKARLCGGEGGGYILFVHPNCLYDLMRTSEWQNYHRDAAEKGLNNPLFRHSGNVAWIDNVAIFSTTNVSRAESASSPTIYYAKNILISARALGIGAMLGSAAAGRFGRLWETRMLVENDYGRLTGTALIGDYAAARVHDAYLVRIESAAQAVA
jgi:N4-gp56 family major capsid protein